MPLNLHSMPNGRDTAPALPPCVTRRHLPSCNLPPRPCLVTSLPVHVTTARISSYDKDRPSMTYTSNPARNGNTTLLVQPCFVVSQILLWSAEEADNQDKAATTMALRPMHADATHTTHTTHTAVSGPDMLSAGAALVGPSVVLFTSERDVAHQPAEMGGGGQLLMHNTRHTSKNRMFLTMRPPPSHHTPRTNTLSSTRPIAIMPQSTQRM